MLVIIVFYNIKINFPYNFNMLIYLIETKEIDFLLGSQKLNLIIILKNQLSNFYIHNKYYLNGEITIDTEKVW